MKQQRKKQKNTSSSKWIDPVNVCFLIYILTVFILFLNDRYFDITKTRMTVFIVGVVIYSFFAVPYYVFGYIDKKYSKEKKHTWTEEPSVIDKIKGLFGRPEIWAVFFLCANILACVFSIDSNASWTGAKGRYFGLEIMIFVLLAFILLSLRFVGSAWIYWLFLGTFIITISIAVIQSFGYDIFKLREEIVERQQYMFVSTIGNINVFGSYLSIAIPFFCGIFVFTNDKKVKISSAVALFIGGLGLIPVNSDNIFLALGSMFLVLLFLVIFHGKMFEYVLSICLIVTGLMTISLLNKINTYVYYKNGLQEKLCDPSFTIKIGLIAYALCALTLFLKRVISAKNISSKKVALFTLAGIILGAIVFIIVGIKQKSSLFVFDYRWGTYRGYIWGKCFKEYKEASILHKIFGYGNETTGIIMNKNYYDEMIALTGKVFDNAHSEPIQYLFTTGAFGLIAYVGLIVTSFITIFKSFKGEEFYAACLMSVVGYFSQSLVDITQPITTPLFFVMLAVCVGCARSGQENIEK
ncbi:MAG: O-antigen ligase family protein [Eubacterium sp.]|nr:O-antigen ligase family protein [Eubacterium sp.]